MLLPTYTNRGLSEILHVKASTTEKKRMLACFFAIYKANSVTKRDLFFSDPLNQFLWKIFIEEAPEKLTDYLQSVKRDSNRGHDKFMALTGELE